MDKPTCRLCDVTLEAGDECNHCHMSMDLIKHLPLKVLNKIVIEARKYRKKYPDTVRREWYALIEPLGVTIRDRASFKKDGGLKDDWGKRWEVVYGTTREMAEIAAQQIRSYRHLTRPGRTL